MKTINLLPKEELHLIQVDLASAQVVKFWVAVMTLLLVLIAGCFAVFLYLNQRVQSIESEIFIKKAQLSSDETKNLEQEVKLLNQQVNLVSVLRNNHYYWSDALEELARVANPDVVLVRVAFERATGKVSVQGTSDTRDGVLKFWEDVIKSDLFERIDFPLPNLERDVDSDFSFTFYVNEERMKR